MSKLNLIGLGLVLAAAPLASAHLDGTMGYPKTYCESTDIYTHDYGPVATGRVLSEMADGNLQDCDGDFDPTNPVHWAEEIARVDLDEDGQVHELTDFDGHSEYARGGAWLLVVSGDGTFGSEACFGEPGHHPHFGPVHVEDFVLGEAATFRVTADSVSVLPNPPGEPACGDLQADEQTLCLGSCSVTFSPGVDGAYAVFVEGTVGHVFSN
jgi:hypothetical protein